MHLYLHIPYCISKCDYCDFFSVPRKQKNVPDEYLEALCREIEIKSEYYGIKSWSTVYIGGGTPSLLSAGQIKILMDCIKKTAPVNSGAEITMEINPETIDETKLEACSKNGINRISAGIQSLKDEALLKVHRHCNSAKAIEAMELLKRCWKGRLSVDLIAGLSGQSEEEFLQAVEKLIEYKPDHFSLYSLCIEEETPLGKSIENPEETSDEADRLFLLGRDLLCKNGFIQYEVSNFAREGFEAVHNSSYWNQESYMGCGAGACSTVYDWNRICAVRTTNTTDLEEYINFWKNAASPDEMKNIPCEKEQLDSDTLEFEYFMQGLRLLKGINEKDYREHFLHNEKSGGNLQKRMEMNENYSRFTEKGYLVKEKDSEGRLIFHLTQEGILFLNSFLSAF